MAFQEFIIMLINNSFKIYPAKFASFQFYIKNLFALKHLVESKKNLYFLEMINFSSLVFMLLKESP